MIVQVMQAIQHTFSLSFFNVNERLAVEERLVTVHLARREQLSSHCASLVERSAVLDCLSICVSRHDALFQVSIVLVALVLDILCISKREIKLEEF